MSTCGYDYLHSLGIGEVAAAWITDFVDRTGGLLQSWGVDPKVRRLIASMHSESWFPYGDLETIIKTEVADKAANSDLLFLTEARPSL